jgi:hypothetical protein
MANNFRPVKDEIRVAASANQQLLSFPSNEATHGMLLIFREYAYTPSTERGFSRLGGDRITSSILLPLPANIPDNYDVRVERFDQGILGDAISQTSSYAFAGGAAPTIESVLNNAGMPSVENMTKAGSTALAAAAGFLASKTPGGALIGALVGDALDTRTVASSIEAGAGVLANPKAALQFKGVDMKRHSFSWTLAPKSEEESNKVEEIIRTIKKNVLPSYSATFQRAMLKYPSFVDCFFIGLDPQYYFSFKTSMVQTFNVNYTPNGVSILRGGRPAAIQIDMSMIESDIHTSEDYS